MLTERGKQIRRDSIYLSKANGGYHYGGSFSCVEILIVLYDHVIKEDDRFILSKGHACWPYYVLLRELGYDPKLEGHPSRDPSNGVLCNTGSLGHGLPMAVGMAIAKKYRGEEGRVYVLMGDGECQEGTTWESMLIAARHKLNNLTVIVDWNGIQGSGHVLDILDIDFVKEGSFLNIANHIGWDSAFLPGHDIEVLKEYLSRTSHHNWPVLYLAKTIKGKGVSFMENNPEWHAKWPNPKEEKQMLEELS